MHCDLVMLLRHDRRTVKYQSWVSLTISRHHSPILYTSWLVQVFSYFIRWVVTIISRWSVYLGYHIHCWTLRGPLGLRAGPMAAKAEQQARWQQRCRHHGTAWVASESFLLLWLRQAAKASTKFGHSAGLVVWAPWNQTVVASPTQAPASKRILVLVWRWPKQSSLGLWKLVRVCSGIPHQFQVHSLSWMCFFPMSAPNKHLVWCLGLSVIMWHT